MINNVAATVGYGARPVSIDIARGRALRQADAGVSRPILPRSLPLTHQVVADRLALARWPYGHQVMVCSLDGGTGRTTLAGLMATVLAELPYAHLHRPVALVESDPRTLSVTPRRWDVVEPNLTSHHFEPIGSTPTGAWAFRNGPSPWKRDAFSVLVVDAPVGLPSDLAEVVEDPGASVVLVTRPDRASLADAADALVFMNECRSVERNRVNVVINNGIGEADRHAKAAATVLGIRCAAIHSLRLEPTLAPGTVLPSGRALPTRLRRTVARICLDVWSTIARPPTTPTPEEHQ